MPTRSAYAADPSWWDNSYGQRLGVTIQTVDALASGYSVSVTFNHAAMVSVGASRSDGEDLRVVHWNGASWDAEQDRVLAIGSSWNSPTTTVYFKTSAAISANTFDRSYFLYFGKAGAPASLHNPHNVYLLFDDFNSGSLDTTKWLSWGPAGSAIQQNGKVEFHAATAGASTSYGIRPNTPPATTNYIAESSFAISKQPAGSTLTWKGAAGISQQDGITHRSGSIMYQDDAYAETTLGPSTLTSNTFSNQRLSAAHVSLPSAHAYYWENGVLKGQHATLHASSTMMFYYNPSIATSAEDFVVSFDDIVIRKHVVNGPTSVVDGWNQIQLSAVIDPIFTFAVSGRPTSDGPCNGVAPTSGIVTTSTDVPFGALTTGTRMAAQKLTVSTNAANGYSVYARHVAPFQSSSHVFAAVPGTNISPSTFPATEAFGYTTDGISRFASDKWAAFTATNEQIATQAIGPRNDTFCLGYQIRAESGTPAGNYITNVVLTAVPQF